MNETIVGKPIPRVDGVLKVSGRVTYAAEHDLPNLGRAVMVTSTLTRGRVMKLDVTAAEHAAGVVAVITYLNVPKLPYRPQKSAIDPSGERLHVLQDDACVRLLADGRAIVESAASDMGPGTYTSTTRVASDALGIPPDRVRFALGDSTFPYTAPHGGSQTMASIGSAMHTVCLALRAKALELAAADERSS